jgi:hypothetical protein
LDIGASHPAIGVKSPIGWPSHKISVLQKKHKIGRLKISIEGKKSLRPLPTFTCTERAEIISYVFKKILSVIFNNSGRTGYPVVEDILERPGLGRKPDKCFCDATFVQLYSDHLKVFSSFHLGLFLPWDGD